MLFRISVVTLRVAVVAAVWVAFLTASPRTEPDFWVEVLFFAVDVLFFVLVLELLFLPLDCGGLTS